MADKPQFKKGDMVWMGVDQSSAKGRGHTGYWEWKQVKVINFDPDKGEGGEYTVKVDPGQKNSDTLSVTVKELEGWQNLKNMQ